MSHDTPQTSPSAVGNEPSSMESSDLHLFFALGDEIYATRLMEIRELLEPGLVRRVPDTVDCFEGLMNVRGEIVAVIDLRKRFGLASIEVAPSILLVFDTENGPIAARVDKALRVLQVPDEKIVKQPGISSIIPREYMVGAADIEGRIIAFLDIKRILSKSELATIGARRAASE